MGRKLKDLRTDLLPFVQEAKEYYQKSFDDTPGLRGVSLQKSIKYFDMLLEKYKGASYTDLAKKNKMHPGNIRTMIITTQGRVERFARIHKGYYKENSTL